MLARSLSGSLARPPGWGGGGDHLAGSGRGRARRRRSLICCVLCVPFLKTLPAYASSAWLAASWGPGGLGGHVGSEGAGAGPHPPWWPSPSSPPPAWPGSDVPREGPPAFLKCHFPLQEKGPALPTPTELIYARFGSRRCFLILVT